MNGYIKLHRKLTEWEWYTDSHTKSLFIHLLLIANHAPSTWKGVHIERGQCIVGRKKLSAETGISEQSIRTSLEKLKKTKEVTIKTTNKYSIVTICNYDYYQSAENTNQQTNQQLTSNQPATNQQLTTNKNNKEEKEEKEEKEVIDDVLIFPFDTENFKNYWKMWKAYKKEQHNFTYKSKKTEQAALVDLSKISNGNESEAIDIIMQSISKGWQGLFELKNKKTNGKTFDIDRVKRAIEKYS